MGGSAREERWEGSRGRTGTLYGKVSNNIEFENNLVLSSFFFHMKWFRNVLRRLAQVQNH